MFRTIKEFERFRDARTDKEARAAEEQLAQKSSPAQRRKGDLQKTKPICGVANERKAFFSKELWRETADGIDG
jgi:hypothetical protein